MDWFWNWGGECFGYRDGDNLFTYFGREVGRFDGEEIYGSNGRYLGEVMSDNRLMMTTVHVPTVQVFGDCDLILAEVFRAPANGMLCLS
jgi:hypothetical protein